MTRRIGDLVFIFPEDPTRCELCGTLAETRPYGPPDCTGRYVNVCFSCAMADEAGTARRFREVMLGEITDA